VEGAVGTAASGHNPPFGGVKAELAGMRTFTGKLMSSAAFREIRSNSIFASFFAKNFTACSCDPR